MKNPIFKINYARYERNIAIQNCFLKRSLVITNKFNKKQVCEYQNSRSVFAND